MLYTITQRNQLLNYFLKSCQYIICFNLKLLNCTRLFLNNWTWHRKAEGREEVKHPLLFKSGLHLVFKTCQRKDPCRRTSFFVWAWNATFWILWGCVNIQLSKMWYVETSRDRKAELHLTICRSVQWSILRKSLGEL